MFICVMFGGGETAEVVRERIVLASSCTCRVHCHLVIGAIEQIEMLEIILV